MMTFKTETVRTCNSRRNPNLSYIMRFGSSRVILNGIFQLAREYRAVGITGYTSRDRLSGKNNHDGTIDISWYVGRDPILIVFGGC